MEVLTRFRIQMSVYVQQFSHPLTAEDIIGSNMSRGKKMMVILPKASYETARAPYYGDFLLPSLCRGEMGGGGFSIAFSTSLDMALA